MMDRRQKRWYKATIDGEVVMLVAVAIVLLFFLVLR